MNFLANAITAFQAKLELLLNTRRKKVFLEDEQIAIIVEHNELGVGQCNDTVNPQRDVRAG